MLGYLLLLLIALPIAEFYVALQAAEVVGIGGVILATIATAVIGSAILRWQGLKALNQLRSDMNAGNSPVEPVVDGVFLIIAAPFLITPGFITDAIGFALLVPPVRHFLARQFLARIKRSIDRGDTRVTFRRF